MMLATAETAKTMPGTSENGVCPTGREHLVLVGLSGWAEGVELTLGGAATIIGRSSTCDLQLLDDHISRQHARVSRVPDEDHPGRSFVVIEDLKSRNGIRVNGRRVVRAVLDGGDTIHLGRSSFRLDRRDDL
jgi:S-DNA-T family DNA segregation ATPase FtsK/SpoIIIE